MEGLLPRAQISSSSRRRLARWLVGSPIRMVERDLILETLAHTHGNRTLAARLLGVSVRTLRNRIVEYSATGRPTTNQPVTARPSMVGTPPLAAVGTGIQTSATPCSQDKAATMAVSLGSMRRLAASDCES